ncbi:MAG: glycosyltransferase involved in cell wall biosynthesis, partial [Ulvibacter sp.]
VAVKINSSFSAHCKSNKIPHIDLNFNGSFDFKTARKISFFCKKNKIDFMHAHSGNSHSLGVISQWFGNKTPLILSRRVDFPIKKNAWAQWKYNHSCIKKIICVSDAIKNILAIDILVKNKLVTIHSGIDLKKFDGVKSINFLRNKYEISDNKKLIGNTSAIAPHKDYFTFVDTCELLIKENINAIFFIIGAGPMEQEIKNYVQSKELNEHIIFTGFLNNIPEVLPELDIFLITSETEGLGTSIIDSFASKIPVVATNAGGIAELVLNGKTGLLSDIKNPNALAKNILKLMSDEILRSKITDGALDHLKNFTKEKTAAKTLAVYQDLLNN